MGLYHRQQNEGSFRVVCRDATHKYIGASSIKCSCITDPATLEALAYREALSLVLDLSLLHVLIASDCKEVVLNINKGIRGLYAGIVKEINAMTTQLTRCSFFSKDLRQTLRHLALLSTL